MSEGLNKPRHFAHLSDLAYAEQELAYQRSSEKSARSQAEAHKGKADRLQPIVEQLRAAERI